MVKPNNLNGVNLSIVELRIVTHAASRVASSFVEDIHELGAGGDAAWLDSANQYAADGWTPSDALKLAPDDAGNVQPKPAGFMDLLRPVTLLQGETDLVHGLLEDYTVQPAQGTTERIAHLAARRILKQIENIRTIQIEEGLNRMFRDQDDTGDNSTR